MINLIPPKAKAEVVREYWIRVVSLWLFLLTAAVLVVAALSVPTFILVNTLSQSISSQVAQVSSDQSLYKESETIIKDTNTLVNSISDTTQRVKFSELIYDLQAIAGREVNLTQFTFKEKPEGLEKIALIGTATTRTSLSKFREDLENNEKFAAVELPISNLAKDKDITFSMTVDYEVGKK